ncbi:MAG: BolA family transcriptional regulator [Pelagibacterales bacterium]|nr:BolA family transcriptional regulator [Pelagibacterales bacterium]PPR17219.1 MAG: DNA-binding transcriptional regulator BolA [Alphaproteobacteria bacterium MarineAlpha9_Bin3]|tara:strand:- start:8753 stop:9022 length:270 start_codon:yes stop_codon:yes gene_type:complete
MITGNRKKRIEKIINDNLDPIYLDVIDDSKSHQGHYQAPDSGESHYNVTIISKVFIGKNRLERERIVHSLLKKEFNNGLHALSLKLSHN